MIDGTLEPFEHSPLHLYQSNKFTSPFWTRRRWLFQAELLDDHINFYIRADRYGQRSLDMDYESIQAGRLVIHLVRNHNSDKDTMMNVSLIQSYALIHHLEIANESCLSLKQLTIATSILSELQTLKIYSLPEGQRKDAVEPAFLCLTSKTNTITKISVNDLSKLEDFYMLLYLYPSMEYLEIRYTGDMDVELFLQIIAKTIVPDENYRLRLLCFHALKIDDDDDVPILRKLIPIIHSNKLSLNYTVQRIDDKLYLQWK